MSENASENENTGKPAAETAKPKGGRKAGRRAKPAKEGEPRQEASQQTENGSRYR